MSKPTYILCPGQGAQVVAMGRDFYDASPQAREIFDAANTIVGFDLKSLCFDGPQERLNQTDISQPAIYTTSIASYHACAAAGLVQPDEVTAYAGLSLGEYTALHLAGVFSFEDGLKLVAARGRYMQEAATANPSSMVAIMGADEAKVDELCAQAAQGQVLVPANFNAPGQIVISGTTQACHRALALAEQQGLKAVALQVAGAFHSPLMQAAADRMRAELGVVAFKTPTRPVYANVTAQLHGDTSSIKELLVQQIVASVRWSQTMQGIINQNQPDVRFIELAPGRTLAGLAKRINRRLPVESFATVEALNSAKN
ncbi:MAG: ACP S-malonyltransferase [Phycisphaerales bacterium]|nr:ACP S-malonyltransferase [Phycisphaerales bacterium]